ncbi:ABC transporter permease, partial [Escherichia coli]|nr:ABC transporter permease [Escherichia coli]
VLERFSATLILGGSALLLSSILGLLAGVLSAIRQFSWSDRFITLAVLLGISMPSFWIGLLMIMLFSVQLQWFPASGMYDIWQGGGLSDLLHHLVLPAVTLS